MIAHNAAPAGYRAPSVSADNEARRAGIRALEAAQALEGATTAARLLGKPVPNAVEATNFRPLDPPAAPDMNSAEAKSGEAWAKRLLASGAVLGR
jgi:hypothetical protein